MPHIFDTSSLEAKILLLLVEIYPVTDRDIAEYLGAPKQKIERSLKILAAKGLVSIEPLGDIVYVTIASGDFSFKGKETEQLKRVREKMKKRQDWTTPDDDDSPMYG